jgi:transketolase C-terminal domain/subunit
MRAMPEMTVIVPADALEAGKWVPVIAEYDGPVYLRISRAATIPVHNEALELEIGKGIRLRDGSDVTLWWDVACGPPNNWLRKGSMPGSLKYTPSNQLTRT